MGQGMIAFSYKGKKENLYSTDRSCSEFYLGRLSFASTSVFSLYLIYQKLSPESETDELKRLQSLLPRIEPGEGRTIAMQALYQLISLLATLLISLLTGALTGKQMLYVKFVICYNIEYLDDYEELIYEYKIMIANTFRFANQRGKYKYSIERL